VLTGLNGHSFVGRDHGGQEITGHVVDYFEGYLVLEVTDPAGSLRVLRRLCDCVDHFRFQPPTPPRSQETAS
jgi:hypothetical protein